MQKLKLFYSYSHKDEAFREKLETHLSILRRNGYISEWHDRRISAGSEWEVDINYNLEEADIILLLVSSNFLASDYCYDTETIRALEKHKEKQAIVIPIILSPCLWLESKLSELQSLPRDNRAVTTFDNEDVAWLEVAEGILDALRSLPEKAPTSAHIDKPLSSSESSQLILDFLNKYNSWFFSPLRIKKWGARQPGFEHLSRMTTKGIKAHLEQHTSSGKVKTTISQKGNTIYKSVV